MTRRTLLMVLAMSIVALVSNALVPGCSTQPASQENVVAPAEASAVPAEKASAAKPEEAATPDAAAPASPAEAAPAEVAQAQTPSTPAPPAVRVAKPLPPPNPAPVVAIVVRPMQETDDKEADAIANQQAINEMVAEAIELTGGLADIVKEGQTVLLKPNLTNHRNGQYFPSMTTDVRVMSAVVDALKKNGDNKLIFAEGSGPPAMEMFRVCGYDKLAEKHGIDLVELNTPDYFVDVQVEREVFLDTPLPPAEPVSTGKHTTATHPLPKPYLDADVVINVPCLKTHCLTGITVAMKNLYGLYPGDRQAWHADVERNLADLARVRPTALVVVDGIVAMEGDGPLWGTPVKMNLIIAGRDMVAVDAVSAAVMGFDTHRVLHVQYAARQGAGVADLDKIVIKGTPIEQAFQRKFADGYWWFSMTCPKTDANIAKLLEQKNKRVIGGWAEEDRGKVIGWESYYEPADMPIDTEKYPDMVRRGFSAAFNKYDEKIHFNTSYRALHREDIEPTRQAMQAWIDANMETEKPATAPAPFLHQDEDVRTVMREMREQQQREQREREQREKEQREKEQAEKEQSGQ